MEDESKLGTIEYLAKSLEDVRIKTDADFALILKTNHSEEFTLNPVPNFSFRFSENRQKDINRGDIYSPSLKKYTSSLIKLKSLDINPKDSSITEIYDKYFQAFHNNLRKVSFSKGFNLKQVEFHQGFINVWLEDLSELPKLNVARPKEKEAPKNEQKFEFVPIGTLYSCFPEKFSVPRQGNLLKLTRAKIVINNSLDLHCLDGVEYFDYFWIIYIFHLHQDFTKTKIAPPKFKGKKLGVYATRSPHRFNPIGLTLAKLEKIERNEIFLSGVDMVSGTPILDIKPYHHLESIPMTPSVKYPEWIRDESEKPVLIEVKFSQESIDDIKNILSTKKLMFYDNFEEIFELIKGILEINPHSRHDNAKKETLVYGFYLDKMNVIYEYESNFKKIVVIKVEYYEEYKKIRTKDWLKENFLEPKEKTSD